MGELTGRSDGWMGEDVMRARGQLERPSPAFTWWRTTAIGAPDSRVDRQQPKRNRMAGPHCAEVTLVQGGELHFPEPLHHGQNSRIDEPEVGVRVQVGQLAYSPMVVDTQVLDPIRSRCDVVQKCHENADVQALVDPVVHFDEHGRGNDERLARLFDQLPAGCMVLVAAIEGRVQRTRIEN